MKLYHLFFFLLLTVLSCKKDEEKTISAPQFGEIRFNGTTVTEDEETEADVNEQLKIDVALSSDAELSQLSVEIHEAFNEHDHDHSRTLSSGTDTLSYGPAIINLSGKTYEGTVYNEVIPETTKTGEYHLELIVLDSEGNRTESITEFHVHEHE